MEYFYLKGCQLVVNRKGLFYLRGLQWSVSKAVRWENGLSLKLRPGICTVELVQVMTSWQCRPLQFFRQDFSLTLGVCSERLSLISNNFASSSLDT